MSDTFLRPQDRFGRVFDGTAGLTLAELTPTFLQSHLAEDGLLVFRNFHAAAADIAKLLGFLGHVWRNEKTSNREDHPTVQGLQTVNIGDYSLGWHAEFGMDPVRPDLIAFFCEEPGSGGDTLVCDGAALWPALKPSSREYFQKNRIRFPFQLHIDHLRRLFALQGSLEVATVVDKINRSKLGLEVSASTDGVIRGWWKPQVYTQRADGRTVLACNVFEKVYRDYHPMAEDGTPLSRELVDDVQRAADEVYVRVTWAKGDFVLIDNQRCLHARDKPGVGRVVYSLFGLTRESLVRISSLLR